MRFARALAALALIPIAAVHADDLVLKDGRTVTWTHLSDLGDTYEVTTPDGTKLEVKKSDVARFVPKDRAQIQKDKAVAPLAGATFTWEKGVKLQEYDLLKAADLKRDTVGGEWKMAGRVVTCVSKTGQPWTRLETTTVLPAEYDFTITLERMDNEGENGFLLTMPGATGTQFGIAIGHRGMVGAMVVEGKWCFDAGGTGVKELPFIKPGVQRTVVIQIRKIGFAIKLDGKELVVWTGDWSKVQKPEPWGIEKEKTITLINSALKIFRIHQAVVTFPK